MKMIIALLSSLVGFIFCRDTVLLALNQKPNEQLRLAFGSCFRVFDKHNEMFETIGKNKPHLWTWMGDAAYTDNVKFAPSKDIHLPKDL